MSVAAGTGGLAVGQGERDRFAILDARLWLRTLSHVAVAAVVACGILGVANAARGIASPGELMFSEGTMVLNFFKVRDGAPLYGSYQDPPFLAVTYTPVYYWLVGLGARWGGLDVYGTLVLARLVSAAGFAVLVAALVAASRLCGASWRASAIAGALPVASFVFYPWAYTARPDMPALGLSLAAVAIAMSGSGMPRAVAAATLLAVAFYTKQSFVAGAAALVIASLHRRQFRFAVAFGLVYVAEVAAAFLGLEWQSGGLFSANVVATNAVPMQPMSLVRYGATYVALSSPLVILAAYGWPPSGASARPGTILKWYALISAVLAGFTIMKVGSYLNYFLEMTCALIVLAGLGLDRIAGRSPFPIVFRSWRQRDALPLHLAVAIAVVYSASVWTALVASSFQQLRQSDEAVDLAVLIRDTPGEVLTDRDSLAVLRAGKLPWVPDPLHVSVLTAVGRWDPEPLFSAIERGEFSLVVLRSPADQVARYDGFPWWPEGTLERVQRCYAPAGRYGPHYLYQPLPECRPN